jgi:FkbM family methyltransferase
MKPWYVWRPWQLVRRARAEWSVTQSGNRALPVAWGVSLLADPRMTIGRSIQTTGVHDPAVTEVLARLIQRGDTVVDAGAHIGYMTALAALAAGPAGHVVSWEPHPGLFEVLQRNVAELTTRRSSARITLHNAALADTQGTADLTIPDVAVTNDGMACLARANGLAGRSLRVRVDTLDDALADTSVAVMKLDVEGSELLALSGASRALHDGRIRHIVFEDHRGPSSGVMGLLMTHGYEIFAMGWSIRGPKLGRISGGPLAAAYEAPNYLATLAAAEVQERCAKPGWVTLSSRFARAGGMR